MEREKPHLSQMLEADQLNIPVTIDLLTRFRIYQFFEELPILVDELLPAIQQHMPEDDYPFERKADDGTTVPTYDFILRTYMLLSAHQQFAFAIGHLLRGQVNEVAGHVRRAIEAAGIAYLSKSERDLGDVFMEGDPKKLRARTTTSKILPSNDPVTAP